MLIWHKLFFKGPKAFFMRFQWEKMKNDCDRNTHQRVPSRRNYSVEITQSKWEQLIDESVNQLISSACNGAPEEGKALSYLGWLNEHNMNTLSEFQEYPRTSSNMVLSDAATSLTNRMSQTYWRVREVEGTATWKGASFGAKMTSLSFVTLVQSEHRPANIHMVPCGIFLFT